MLRARSGPLRAEAEAGGIDLALVMKSNNSSVAARPPIGLGALQISHKEASLSILIPPQRLLVLGEQRCSGLGRAT